MSLRLEMLQVSRLAPKPLGESADLVRDFVLGQLTDEGGFRDRQGRADLYYTVFGLDCLAALQADVPRDRVVPYLEGFGDGEGLDLVHLACLARSWTAVGGPRNGTRDAMLDRLRGFGDPESVYEGFLLYGACQDLEAEPPAAETIEALVHTRRADDGGHATTPATTAAVTLLAHLRRPVPASSLRWLESRRVHGGFTAGPGATLPDLLSTAVTLHALAAAERPLEPFVEPCLDFIDTLWTNRGAFHGHWADDEVDCEYTFYGLLALGHLSVWSD